MNPWGFFILALGVLLLIMGVTGSFTKVKAAVTGRAGAAPAASYTGTGAAPSTGTGVSIQ